MKFSIDSFLKNDWIPFLNINFKWGVALFIRTLSVTLTIISIILLLKVTGIFKDLREVVLQDVMGITPKGTTIISVPDINHTSDIKELEGLIQFLEGLKKVSDEAK